MIRYAIDYIAAETIPRVYYLQMDGQFRIKPHRYFEGDNMYPDYYHAKWMDERELIETLKRLTLSTSEIKGCIQYRVIQLNIKFEKIKSSKIPRWTSEILGYW